MDNVMEILKNIVNFLVIIVCIVGLLYFAICMVGISFYLIYGYFIEPIINFFKKRKAPKEPMQPPAPLPCEKCKKLEAERDLLKERLNTIQAEHDKETLNLCQKLKALKTQLKDDDGEFIKELFDSIILSFIGSKPLVPNVSIEHLTNLCNISRANAKFFRALLQEFEIENLTITNENGKHNISMEIKSGKNTYTTTLTDCTCGDDYNQTKPKVCKHMYFLAITIGLISSKHYEAFQKNALKSLPEEKIKSLKKK